MTEVYTANRYNKIFDLHSLDRPIVLTDHLGGFEHDLTNHLLSHLNKITTSTQKVSVNYLFNDAVKNLYANLDFVFDHIALLSQLSAFNVHAENLPREFLCSFNRSAHVSRKLLVSALHRFGYFSPMTCSKHFSFDTDTLDGHLQDYLDLDKQSFYQHFFIAPTTAEFGRQVNSFPSSPDARHRTNIHYLEPILTRCFLHLVSETMATSYYPFVTEKFLYSVVTRGLFLAYAQPGWHGHLESNYGFRKYSKIFDYRFDEINNPVERLIELMSMIAKFSVLSSSDWQDLYEMEIDTIEYNYDHYFSRSYKKHLEQFC